jgi:hypothetical protein
MRDILLPDTKNFGHLFGCGWMVDQPELTPVLPFWSYFWIEGQNEAAGAAVAAALAVE